jgi:hypothetical protein
MNANTRGRVGQQLAHSVDNAMNFLRGLVPTRKRDAKARVVREKSAAPREASPTKQSLQRLELAHKELVGQVARLEVELERMHMAITSGAPSADRSGDRLTDYMEGARQLRDRIQEKRLEVVRLERRIARERQLLGLSGTAEQRAAAPAAVPAAAMKPAVRPEVSRPLVTESSIKGALERSNIQEAAERLLVAGIADGLRSENPEVRRQAMIRLGARPQPVVRLLVLGADDPDERVRLAALSGLVGQKGTGVVELFRRFLSEKSAALRLAALRGLASVDAELLTTSELKAALDDAEPTVRRAAASVIGMRRENGRLSARLMRALCFALYDEDEAVRVSAVEALGDSGDDSAVLALIRAIGDSAEAVRDAARRSLHAMLGYEVDAILDAAPAEERVEALKIWWRGARVRLRTGPGRADPLDVEITTREVLDTLATLKAGGALPPRPTKPETAVPRKTEAPTSVAAAVHGIGKEKAASKETPKEIEPPAAAAEGESSPAEEGETQDFESMFQESANEEEQGAGEGEAGGEGKKGEGEGEGEGGEEYENILGGNE